MKSEKETVHSIQDNLEWKCDPVKPRAWSDHSGLVKWLEEQAQAHQFQFLLAHADDAVIWGRFAPDTCKLTLRSWKLHEDSFRYLQQLRAFGQHAELLLWKSWDRWRGRLITDKQESSENRYYYDENQILVGNRAEPDTESGFTHLWEGHGLHHVVPIAADPYPEMSERHIRLRLRHYLAPDDDGFYGISLSRLVEVFAVREGSHAKQS